MVTKEGASMTQTTEVSQTKKTTTELIKESQSIVDLKLFLQAAKLYVRDKQQDVSNDCSRRGMLRSSILDCGRIVAMGDGWQDRVLEIYNNVNSFPISGVDEVNRIKTVIASFIDGEFNFKDGKPKGNEQYNVDRINSYAKVQVAITTGHNALYSKIIEAKKKGHREIFMMIIPLIVGSLLTLLFSNLTVVWSWVISIFH